MIMGASTSSVWYNLRVLHPTKDVPIIDYDLALLFQPMLLLGITLGVELSVICPSWLITVLIIILFLGWYPTMPIALTFFPEKFIILKFESSSFFSYFHSILKQLQLYFKFIYKPCWLTSIAMLCCCSKSLLVVIKIS